MLQTISKHYRGVLGTFIIVVVGLSMLLFGVDFGARPSESYAIKVGEQKVSFNEFYDRKREVQARFAQTFGENYAQFAQQLLADLNERLADEIIDETLLREAASELGVSPGRRSVQGMVRKILQGEYSEDRYRSLLRQLGTTAPLFEQRLAAETVTDQMRTLFVHTAVNPPEEFIQNRFIQDERKYSLEVVEFAPEAFVSKVEKPDDTALQSYYDEHLLDYELPARARFHYVPFPGDKFLDLVEVDDADVELYYTDNERSFTIPERMKVQEISLNLSSGDPTASMGVQSLANELMERIEKGEDIKALAEEYSDQKKNAEVSNWILKGSQSEDFDQQLFSEEVKAGDVRLIETASLIRIIQVVEREDTKLRPFDEVREEIILAIKKQEAPIYAAERARVVFEEWDQNGTELEEVAKSLELEVEKVEKLTSLEEAAPNIRPIVKEALLVGDTAKLVVDIGESLALVQIDEYRDIEVPPFDDLRDTVLVDYQEEDAKGLSTAAADQYFEAAKELTEFDAKVATDAGGKVEQITQKKINEMKLAPFKSSTVQYAVRSAEPEQLVGESPFTIDDKQYVLWLTAAEDPTPEQFEEKRDQLMKGASQQFAQLIERSILNKMKADADIDVHPSVFE